LPAADTVACPPHLRQIVRKMAVQIATEKSRGNTTVTVPVHPELADSLRAARAAGIIGADVFTGKLVKDRVLPMNKKAWAAKFKNYAVLAGVNEPKKSCHGVRKARAEVAAYADCTKSQMMAMFGWTDPKMPAHYVAKANREKLGVSGMDKIVAFDQSQSLDDFMLAPKTNRVRTSGGNGVVTFPGNFGKKRKDFNAKRGFMVRSERNQPQIIALLSLVHFDYKRAGVSQFVSQFVSHFRLHRGLMPSLVGSHYIGENDPRSNPVELSVNTRWLDNGTWSMPSLRCPRTMPPAGNLPFEAAADGIFIHCAPAGPSFCQSAKCGVVRSCRQNLPGSLRHGSAHNGQIDLHREGCFGGLRDRPKPYAKLRHSRLFLAEHRRLPPAPTRLLTDLTTH
jgi:hypothetical protein